jgi:hypothetical protein
MHRLAGALLVGVVAACNSTAGPTPTPGMPSMHPFPANLGGLVGGEYQVVPISTQGRAPGVLFPLALGHCGLGSPVDVDGSLWEPIGANDARGGPVDTEDEIGELINPTGGEAVVVGRDRLDFRTPLGTVIVFGRHEGRRSYPVCR